MCEQLDFALGLFSLGHIHIDPEESHRLTANDNRNAIQLNIKQAPVFAPTDRFSVYRLAGKHAIGVHHPFIGTVVGQDHLIDLSPQDFLSGITKHCLEYAVRMNNPLRRIGKDNADGSVFKKLLEAGFLELQCLLGTPARRNITHCRHANVSPLIRVGLGTDLHINHRTVFAKQSVFIRIQRSLFFLPSDNVMIVRMYDVEDGHADELLAFVTKHFCVLVVGIEDNTILGDRDTFKRCSGQDAEALLALLQCLLTFLLLRNIAENSTCGNGATVFKPRTHVSFNNHLVPTLADERCLDAVEALALDHVTQGCEAMGKLFLLDNIVDGQLLDFAFVISQRLHPLPVDKLELSFRVNGLNQIT